MIHSKVDRHRQDSRNRAAKELTLLLLGVAGGGGYLGASVTKYAFFWKMNTIIELSTQKYYTKTICRLDSTSNLFRLPTHTKRIL